jgi:DNA adenine methylase
MISWIGGKSKISNKLIIPNIPKDIETYTECFGGAYWVFLKMMDIYPNLKTVVYNDFNTYLVNLFICAKDHKKLHKILGKYKSQNKDLFYEFQKTLYTDMNHRDIVMPDYELAAKFAYLVSQVFSGTNSQTGKFIDLKGKYKSKYDTFADKMVNTKFTNRLDKITNIENLDFEDLIKKYDGNKTFHYIDAPYYGCEAYYSSNDFKLSDHERLANCLKNIKGKFAMSYYFFPQLEEWFPRDEYNWIEMEFTKGAGASKGKTQSKGTELLIMNYGVKPIQHIESNISEKDFDFEI